MSDIICEYCGTVIVDSKTHCVRECEHYPLYNSKVNAISDDDTSQLIRRGVY